MPTREPMLKLITSSYKLKPVPRAEVEDYLKKSAAIASPLTSEGEIDKMNWQAWRDLRHEDYFIQWNINQTRFRISLDEYIARWQWTVRSGRGWESLDHCVHIIDTGFITEAILRSRHVDERGERVILNLCETYHLQDGKALFSNEYIDPTDVRKIDAPIPGNWW
jgi:hypothetical protein